MLALIFGLLAVCLAPLLWYLAYNDDPVRIVERVSAQPGATSKASVVFFDRFSYTRDATDWRTLELEALMWKLFLWVTVTFWIACLGWAIGRQIDRGRTPKFASAHEKRQ
jgi:hypothetical protein